MSASALRSRAIRKTSAALSRQIPRVLSERQANERHAHAGPGELPYDVSQRTREIGVRSAIGASRGQIAGLIVRQRLWKGGIGVVLGLIGAAVLSRSMTTLLFNVRPTDPAVYGAVSFVLIAVALLASYLPARRAARIDPLVALRNE